MFQWTDNINRYRSTALAHRGLLRLQVSYFVVLPVTRDDSVWLLSTLKHLAQRANGNRCDFLKRVRKANMDAQ